MGVYDAHLATSPDAIPVAVRRTKEQAEDCVRFCTAAGSFGQTYLVQMLPFDCCPHEGESVAYLTGRAKALAQEWKRRCDADGCYSPQHDMVICATFHPELARLAQEAFRRQWPKAGEEEADEAAASLSSFEEPAPAGLTLTYDIYVKPPVPCDFITTKLTIEGPSESEADSGRWGVFDAQMLMAYPDTTLPVSVRATKEEAETEAAYLTPGNGRRGKRLHVAKMMPALDAGEERAPNRGGFTAEANPDAPVLSGTGETLITYTYQPQDFREAVDGPLGDGPDYQGPSEGDSSCSSTEQPNHHSWLMRLVGWIRGDRKPEDSSGSGKIIPSCGPPPPAGDKPTSIEGTMDKIDPDWRDKLQKSVGKYVSADDPLVAELLARGAAEARDLIDQAAKESGGQLPAILPAGQKADAVVRSNVPRIADFGLVTVGSDGFFVKDNVPSDSPLAEVESGAREYAKLLPVESIDGETWANARLLHAQLGIGEDFSTWVKRQLAKHGYVENEDFRICSLDLGSKEDLETEGGTDAAKRRGGHNAKEYLLTTDVAKNLAMSCNTPVGRSIRRYLIECERQLRTGGQPRFKQLETLPDPLPKLTHVSTLDERIDDLVGRGLRLMTGLTQDLKEIKKSVDNRRLNLQLKQESPMLPGIQDAELKAAKEHSAGLQATLTKIEKERDELEAKVAELEKPAKTEDPDTLDPGLVNSLECQIERMSDAAEKELADMKGTADKLTDLVEERERLFDKQQKELAEARLETQRVLALVQGPDKDITLTDFFKETESVLGYSDTMGIDYLVRTGVLYREKDELGKKYLWANHDYGCYFHHVARYYDHPITVDGQRTDKFRSVKTYTAKLIPDRKESGQVVKIGGYTWLKERMMEDELTTLQRLIAETGGATGEFKRLDGYVLSKAKEDALPGLMSVGEKVILFAKGTGDFVGVRKDEWIAGCRTESGTERATGLTLRCSLATYRHGASW